MNAVEKHPQRQEIIDRILAGESTRKIAGSVDPKLAQSSLARFRIKMLGPAVRRLAGKQGKSLELQEIARETDILSNAHTDVNPATVALRRRVQRHVDERIERRQRWISDAENRPILDPETGEVVGNSMDHKALAAHDRNEGSDLEFLSRLGGLLQDGAAGTTNVQIAVMVPGAEMPEMACVEIGKTR